MNTTMSAAEIALVDEVLMIAPKEMWDNPKQLAKWVAIPLAARLGVAEDYVEATVSQYISILARNAGDGDGEYVPPPRYNHDDIVADAYASAAAGLEGYTPTPWE